MHRVTYIKEWKYQSIILGNTTPNITFQKCFGEKIQYLPYLWNKKIQVVVL